MTEGSNQVVVRVSDGTTMNAYVARPSGAGSGPGIMVLQDAFGVNPSLREIADRYAGIGFVAIAPELFHRRVTGFTADYNDLEAVMPHVRALTVDDLIADTRACFDWLTTEGGAKRNQIASVGFCMGGRATFIANTALPLAAGISYYGGGIAPALLDRAGQLHGRHLFFWGGQDKGISPEQQHAVADAVRAAGKRFVSVEFSHANHGFFTAHRHDPDAARESWALGTAFLEDALRG